MSSRLHAISYAIGYDSDDPATGEAAYMLGLGEPVVIPYCSERIGSLGQMVNNIAAKTPADVYCSLCDDVEILSRNWDHTIYANWLEQPDGVWWWRALKERPATYAVVSHKWYEAAGYIFTDYFPFWWDDVWLMQVWNLASGKLPLGIDAFLDDRAFATHRMRDLRFWTDFYTVLKPQRLSEAARIGRALGWPPNGKSLVIENGVPLGDVRPGFLTEIPGIEAHQGDKGPATPEYLAAKQRAEHMMRTAESRAAD